MLKIKSPCIKACQIDKVTAVCIGCKRTIREIIDWRSLSDSERDTVMTRLKNKVTV